MLRKTATSIAVAACMLLAWGTSPLYSQGTGNQGYNGLDKYLGQGRPDNASFVGVRAAEFLTIPIGARGIGLGGAYSAVVDDISAIWWNPAGLGFLEKNEVMLTVVDYTMDLTYSYAAAAAPVLDGKVVIGGFFGYLNIPEEEITTINSPNGTGTFYNAYDFQMGGTVAYNLSDRFSAGLSMKYIHQDVLNNMAGNAFAIDAGGVYHTELANREIRFAFSIQNLGTNITMRGPNLVKSVGPERLDGSFPDGLSDFSSDPSAISSRGSRRVAYETHTYRLPTILKIGLAYNLYTDQKVNWLVAGEIWRNSNSPISYTVGTEMNYSFSQIGSAAVRFGWDVQRDEFTAGTDRVGYDYLGDAPSLRGLSLGGGLQRDFSGRTVRFDYAYRNKGRLTADNFFTVSFAF